MKIKIFPKNEQEFSKFFIVLIPFLLLLFGGISLLKEAYFLFVNILPENIVFNYGFLDKLNNHITYSLLLSFLIVFLTSYLLPKTLGRRLVIFPIFFLTSLGVIGLESLDLLLGFLFPNNFYSFGNTTYTMIFKVLIMFAFVGLLSINILAKKEAWRKAQMARPLPLPPRRVAHEVRVAQLSKSHRKRTWGPIGGPYWANKP